MPRGIASIGWRISEVYRYISNAVIAIFLKRKRKEKKKSILLTFVDYMYLVEFRRLPLVLVKYRQIILSTSSGDINLGLFNSCLPHFVYIDSVVL